MEDHWLARPATIRAIWRLFILVLVLAVAAGIPVDMDGHFAIERLFGFNAAFGFLACVVLVVGAKVLGALLKRPDTYYDESRRD